MRGKVLDGDVGRGAEVDLLALRQQAQRVEEAVGPGARLVDAHDDRVALLRDVAQMLDHLHGGRGVQPRCRLVQQEDGGPMQQFDGDAQAALLATRDAFNQRVSYAGVGANQQSHLHDDLLDRLLSGLRRDRSEPRGVAQRLAHGEASQERILLRNVTDDLADVGWMLLAADQNLARGGAATHTTAQEVKQRGLAASRGSHDGHHLSWVAMTRNIAHNCLTPTTPQRDCMTKPRPRDRVSSLQIIDASPGTFASRHHFRHD
mmetsp:Transcript_10208/g.28569  ORF Transcript_10208/g.28569 Transcript_10208/m.28569 type:complete len:261 (-) Transcript_10208:114-896(-)